MVSRTRGSYILEDFLHARNAMMQLRVEVASSTRLPATAKEESKVLVPALSGPHVSRTKSISIVEGKRRLRILYIELCIVYRSTWLRAETYPS